MDPAMESPMDPAMEVPSDPLRIQHRQDLEALVLTPSPLLSPKEAEDLLNKGDRSIGALSYGWLTAGRPDPAGARIEVLRATLEEHPHIEAIFWE